MEAFRPRSAAKKGKFRPNLLSAAGGSSMTSLGDWKNSLQIAHEIEGEGKERSDKWGGGVYLQFSFYLFHCNGLVGSVFRRGTQMLVFRDLANPGYARRTTYQTFFFFSRYNKTNLY